MQRVLVGREYASLGKRERGEIRAYLGKVTGLSLPQVTRLIRMCRETGTIGAKPYGRRRFAKKYTAEDVALLAEVGPRA